MLKNIGNNRSFKNMISIITDDENYYARLPQWGSGLYVQFKYSEDCGEYMYKNLICYDKELNLFKTEHNWTNNMPIWWAMSEDWEIYNIM